MTARKGTDGGPRAGLALSPVLIAAVFLVGCGRLAGGGQAPAPEPTPSAIATSLPELPPNHVLYPELFDEEGCAKLGGGEVDCGAPPLPGYAPVDDPADPEAWRYLLGFHGPSYLGEFPPEGLVLVPGSVSTSSAGPWRAFGLVRNQTSAPVGAEVTATLLAPDGRELGRASAHVPIDPLRPGEPGPFALSSELPAEEVAEVRWEVTATPPGGLVVRDLEIRAPIWELPYGDREALGDRSTGRPPVPVHRARLRSEPLRARAWDPQRHRASAPGRRRLGGPGRADRVGGAGAGRRRAERP